MPFNGSGTYNFPSLPGSFNPAISGQQATPDDWNTLAADLTANGLTNCITKDGQTTVTADIPFANFRLKLVGNATLATDAPNLGQIQGGAGVYAADTGAADAYVIAPAPATAAYAVGQLFRWKIANVNATTTPTLAVNGLTAGTIAWPDGSALAAGDLPADAIVQTAVDTVTTGTPTFQLLTVALPPATINATGPTTQNFTSGSAATYTTPAGAKWIKIRVKAGGGGGGGSGGTTGPTGATGATSIFNSINANGGVGGTGGTSLTNGSGGAGGTSGTGTATWRLAGGGATSAPLNSVAGAASGAGAGSGAGVGNFGNTVTGVDAAANSGGGGGGSVGSTGTCGSGAGGGEGEYFELIISNPAATYTYTVGAGGAGGIGTGSAAATGGAGGSGFITVEEHYNY